MNDSQEVTYYVDRFYSLHASAKKPSTTSELHQTTASQSSQLLIYIAWNHKSVPTILSYILISGSKQVEFLWIQIKYSLVFLWLIRAAEQSMNIWLCTPEHMGTKMEQWLWLNTCLSTLISCCLNPNRRNSLWIVVRNWRKYEHKEPHFPHCSSNMAANTFKDPYSWKSLL